MLRLVAVLFIILLGVEALELIMYCETLKCRKNVLSKDEYGISLLKGDVYRTGWFKYRFNMYNINTRRMEYYFESTLRGKWLYLM